MKQRTERGFAYIFPSLSQLHEISSRLNNLFWEMEMSSVLGDIAPLTLGYTCFDRCSKNIIQLPMLKNKNLYFYHKLGRCLGSVIGALLVEHVKSPMTPKWNNYSSEILYKTGAVLAAIIASLYFVLYHFCLKHKWRKQSVRAPQPVHQGEFSSLN